MNTSFQKPQSLIRAVGLILLLTGIFIFTVPILEQWTFLSTDQEITSPYVIAGITFFRYALCTFGIVLFLYPQILFHLHYGVTSLQRTYERKSIGLPPFLFVAFLCISLILFFLLFAFGHVLGERQYQTVENPTLFSFASDSINTFDYFFDAAVTLFFQEDIDRAAIDIPLYQLYIRKNALDALNKNLPTSGLSYVNGDLVVNDTHYDIDVRYRGDTFYHWYFKKKSWRIKLDDHKLLDSTSRFNIINPKSDSHLDEVLVYTIATEAGLLAPRAYPVALFLNNEYVGVYYYSDQIDELFIRNNDRMPGDIFYGELYGDTTRNGTLFENKSNWDIEATADGNETRAYENMETLLHAINASDQEFYTFFTTHLGDQYLRFYAFTLLIDENRVDDYHNHKLYFNPTNGMFEPIVWDLMPFSEKHVPLNNEQSNVLFSKINRNPLLVEKRNLFLKEYLRTLSEEELYALIDTSASAMEYEMTHDAFKDSYEAPWLLSNKEWIRAQQELKTAIATRYAFIQEELDNTSVNIFLVNDTYLVFDVAGQSGVQIETLTLRSTEIASDMNTCFTLYKDRNFNMIADPTDELNYTCGEVALPHEVLYPGREVPLRYVYIIKKEAAGSFTSFASSFSNSITGTPVLSEIAIIDSIEELPKILDQTSLHPWTILAPEQETITLEGKVSLTENLIISQEDTLIIKPGTTLFLGPFVSLISYGKVIAQGTPEMPIFFVPSTAEPWGALVLQGAAANGSILQHCIIDGGSGTVHDLAVYTGMLSAHNTDITIDHCLFKNNKLKDDALNIKLSHAIVTNSTFTNIFSDAIDLDLIKEGIIANNIFVTTGGDALDLMTSAPFVFNNSITGARDKGISIGEMSSPFVLYNTIRDSVTGIAIKDQSNPIIINNTIENNDVGLAAYEKNWQYGGGGYGTVQGTALCQNQEPLLIQNSSLIYIEQNSVLFVCTEDECSFSCGEYNESVY